MKRRLPAIAALLLFVGLATGFAAHAEPSHLPPWIDPGAPQLPAGTRSARILLDDQPLLTAPFASAPRRGAVLRDIHLPVFAARRGAGCRGSFLEVGPSAWVCDDAVELADLPPIEASRRVLAENPDGLPFRYFFVGPDGSSAYSRLESAEVDTPVMELEKGFAVAVTAERAVDGARYGRTNHNLWVPMRDLGPARSFAFQGEMLPADATSIPMAWVVNDHARVFSKPSALAITSATKARFELVPVLEEAESNHRAFFRIGENAWIAAKDVRHPEVVEPPPEVDRDAGERWIDVDLATQTLVAYEGKRPVFATIVSTGKGREGTPQATPKGTHRIWIKLLTSDMDNLEDENAARYFRIENVPWVQYFSKGVGLHGAFWHRSFGQVRSHGCVNLAPLDAQRLFWWTGPHVPAGWTAVFPTKAELGTVVRVR
jgi:lipoprotein-anchoring transpeptidase ErfK/SrfK